MTLRRTHPKDTGTNILFDPHGNQIAVTDKQILRDQLAEARQLGWALSWEELEIGLAAVGASITGRDGEPVAAVSISGPTARIDRSQIKHLATMVLDTTKRITRELGFGRR